MLLVKIIIIIIRCGFVVVSLIQVLLLGNCSIVVQSFKVLKVAFKSLGRTTHFRSWLKFDFANTQVSVGVSLRKLNQRKFMKIIEFLMVMIRIFFLVELP